ncbi:hypothetical protein ACROYT_G014825 [Oculina patagonica]
MGAVDDSENINPDGELHVFNEVQSLPSQIQILHTTLSIVFARFVCGEQTDRLKTVPFCKNLLFMLMKHVFQKPSCCYLDILLSMPPKKKNKRGARGSTDEEPNVAKRLNMASNNEEAEGTNEHDDIEQDDKEPSLLEIKTLLINIQTSITNITKENQALRKEVSDLKASLEFSDREIKKVKDSLDKAILATQPFKRSFTKLTMR